MPMDYRHPLDLLNDALVRQGVGRALPCSRSVGRRCDCVHFFLLIEMGEPTSSSPIGHHLLTSVTASALMEAKIGDVVNIDFLLTVDLIGIIYTLYEGDNRRREDS